MHAIMARLIRPRLVWLFLAALWGTTWLVVSVGLETLPPFTFAGIRFLVAAVALTLVALVRRTAIPRALMDWVTMVGTGLTAIGLSYAFLFWGMQYVASGLAAVMFSTVPLLTILIAHMVLPEEPLSLPRLGGVLLGTAGVALIFSDQLSAGGPMALWAVIGLLIGAVALAHSQVVLRARRHRVDPVMMAAVQTAVGGAVLLAIGRAAEGPILAHRWSLESLMAVGYLSLAGTALGFVALYYLLQHMPVTKVNSMMLVHPLVAMALGWALLGERLSWLILAGALSIVAGLMPLLRTTREVVPDILITGEFQAE